MTTTKSPRAPVHLTTRVAHHYSRPPRFSSVGLPLIEWGSNQTKPCPTPTCPLIKHRTAHIFGYYCLNDRDLWTVVHTGSFLTLSLLVPCVLDTWKITSERWRQTRSRLCFGQVTICTVHVAEIERMDAYLIFTVHENEDFEDGKA